MKYFIYNGKIYTAGTPIAGPESRAVRYGDGLFETIRCNNSKLAFADEHFSRLWKGMQVLGFEVPKHFNPDHIQTLILDLLKKNKHDSLARIRLSVFRGDGGLYDPINNQPQYTIQTWSLPDGYGQWNSNGLVAGIHQGAKKNCDVLANLKHNSFLPYIVAAQEAKSLKWNDAIVLNNHGRICDSTVANVFLIKDEHISTPALEEGCIAGIMRKTIIRELKSRHYNVEEKEISINELLAADEVFFTNSIHPMRWVKEIGTTSFTSFFTQKIYSELVQTIF